VESIHYIAKQSNRHRELEVWLSENPLTFGQSLEVASVFKFLKNVSREMKKVTWPTGKELFNYTVVVITTVILMAIFFFAVDFVISQLLNMFF